MIVRYPSTGMILCDWIDCPGYFHDVPYYETLAGNEMHEDCVWEIRRLMDTKLREEVHSQKLHRV